MKAFNCPTPLSVRSSPDYKIVCYYGAWSVYRPEPANFGVSDIDPFSCTHVIYSFAGLDKESLTIMSLDAAEDIVKGKLQTFRLIGHIGLSGRAVTVRETW